MFTSEGTFMNNGVMLEGCLVFKVPMEIISTWVRIWTEVTYYKYAESKFMVTEIQNAIREMTVRHFTLGCKSFGIFIQDMP